jgi:single-stranded DNA-binding protein
MIRALITGNRYGDPTTRTSPAGKLFTTAKVKADGKDGAAVCCDIIAFNEQAERLAALPAGAAVSISGKAEVKAWTDRQGDLLGCR